MRAFRVIDVLVGPAEVEMDSIIPMFRATF
jgi:hypothetical protein